MKEKINELLDLYKYILRFHPVRYFGIFVMTVGPLYSIYFYIFKQASLYIPIIGSLGFIALGAFIWQLGWDPYA